MKRRTTLLPPPALPALLALLALLLVVAACPREKRRRARDTFAVDTTPARLDTLATQLPPPTPDTFTPPTPASAPSIPPAPPELMAAVEREQEFAKFCYQEFGLKRDPTLRGGVAVVVTVGAKGITEAYVGNDNWTSRAGKGVNNCLNRRAKQAWKVAPGAVKPGRYVVPLPFRPA